MPAASDCSRMASATQTIRVVIGAVDFSAGDRALVRSALVDAVNARPVNRVNDAGTPRYVAPPSGR